jgi:hypothetical protein
MVYEGQPFETLSPCKCFVWDVATNVTVKSVVGTNRVQRAAQHSKNGRYSLQRVLTPHNVK